MEFKNLMYSLFVQPIIPIFTENVREAFRCMSFGRRYLLKLYLKTRLPFVPIYGGFPVKLRTHVGEPIPYDQNLTPEDLQLKVRCSSMYGILS